MTKQENIGLPRWKRALDVTVVLLALPVLLPLAVVITILIRRSSKGPVLFQQERIGYQGKGFMCLKFRTMYCGAETVSHQGHLKNLMDSNTPMTKMDARGDSRIIPFGKLLRCSGLDELPQLINVLKGEMSLVGPRPCIRYEVEQYQPWQHERFNAVPGLTGLWQVSGKNRTTFTRMIQLDVEYARKKSLWLDLRIMVMTPFALLVQMWDTYHLKKSQPCVVAAPAPLTIRATNN
jgi:lipopolysaccharide/colanic/teichoic acid biosynthesis glycosyltransferase